MTLTMHALWLTAVVMTAIAGLWAHLKFLTSQRYVRVVVGRGLHELHRRGMKKDRALELIAPEIRDELRKMGGVE